MKYIADYKGSKLTHDNVYSLITTLPHIEREFINGKRTTVTNYIVSQFTLAGMLRIYKCSKIIQSIPTVYKYNYQLASNLNLVPKLNWYE